VRFAARLRRFEPLLGAVRPAYRWLRTRYLRLRHPRGGYVVGNGVRVFCDFRNATYVWYDADSPSLAFEQSVIRRLLAASEGNVFIDVGAHFGFYAAVMAEFASAEREHSKVIAIEPDPASFRCLERTLEAHSGRVTARALNLAVSDADGEVTLYRSRTAPCLHTYSDPSAEPASRIAALRLDSIVAEHLEQGDTVAVIKVDVDGAEALFFRGAAETLRRHRPLLFVEFSPSNLAAAGVDPSALLREASSHGEVHWVDSRERRLVPLSDRDWRTIVPETDGAVADLVIAPRPLRWS
jgi:FkbM family methyltransferase